MKILYLFNGFRGAADNEILRGENHDGHFHGMYRLRRIGFDTDFDEIEKHLPRKLATRIRRFITTYFIHLLTFPRIFYADVVISPTAFSSLFLKRILCLRRPRWLVLDFGLIGMIGENKSWKQRLLKFAIAGADGIITLSPREKSDLQRLFPDKGERIRFLYHGVDTEYFKPDPKIDEENIVFSPGRDAGRDFKTLIEATKNLEAKVIITARDEFIANLKPLPANMIHTSYKPLELVRAYNRARVAILSLTLGKHNNDAMGLSTLMEMMSTGKAIIATDTETMRAYITHNQNGLLVPEGDAKAMESAVRSLLADPAKRQKLGQAAREFTLKHCRAELWADRLAEYFEMVVS